MPNYIMMCRRIQLASFWEARAHPVAGSVDSNHNVTNFLSRFDKTMGFGCLLEGIAAIEGGLDHAAFDQFFDEQQIINRLSQETVFKIEVASLGEPHQLDELGQPKSGQQIPAGILQGFFGP